MKNGSELRRIDRRTAIGDLRPGDLVDTTDGLVDVSAITVPGYAADVYNIEVHGEHVYRQAT